MKKVRVTKLCWAFKRNLKPGTILEIPEDFSLGECFELLEEPKPKPKAKVRRKKKPESGPKESPDDGQE